jgi:hypothetical protein
MQKINKKVVSEIGRITLKHHTSKKKIFKIAGEIFKF